MYFATTINVSTGQRDRKAFRSFSPPIFKTKSLRATQSRGGFGDRGSISIVAFENKNSGKYRKTKKRQLRMERQ